MTAYRGKDLVMTWVSSSGTVALAGDYRSFTETPSIQLLDQSAGADTNRTYVTGLKDGTLSATFLMQSGGTALTNALVEGTEGTLTVGPEGTAGGKPKRVYPAIAQGVKQNIRYADLVEITVDWQQNGTRTDGVY